MSETILTFVLDGETFGLPVGAVCEVIDPLPVTPVPRAPVFAPGLVNVRGTVAPLVDLRARLGLGPDGGGGGGPGARMLVLDAVLEGEETKVVALADGVDSIAELPEDAVEPVPELGTRWRTEAVRGVIRREDDVVALLDVARLLAPEGAGDGA